MQDEWLRFRKKQDSSIYSANADYKTELMLRKQNDLTFKTASSSLLDDPAIFENNLTNWASIVAKSRIESNTPIFEVLDALSKYRDVYWKYTEQYINAQNEQLCKDLSLKWCSLIHTTYDQMNRQFAVFYDAITSQRLNAQQSLINELSSPIIPITDTAGVLPLIGDIDSTRARLMIENIPKQCIHYSLSHLFIDLSGVPLIDTLIAQQLFHLTNILELLGIKSTISGMSPEVALTSIHLGISFNKVQTYNTLRQALQKTGTKIQKN